MALRAAAIDDGFVPDDDSFLVERLVERPPFLKRIWTPFRLVVFLTLLNLLNYFDRGAIAGVLTDLEKQYDLSGTDQGMLAGAFMIGFMVANPIFTHLATVYQPTKLIFVGLALWSAATIGTAVAPDFWTLAMMRMVTGAGEASFAGLAPTLIDDNAPAHARTKWLSMFFAAIPVGAALGYACSGIIAENWTWEAVFVLEGLVMIPFAFTSLVLPANTSQGHLELPTASEPFSAEHFASPFPDAAESRHVDLGLSVRLLAKNRIYTPVVLGYAFYTAVIGALAFWSPSFLETKFDLQKTEATSVFGAITITAGLGGTAFGGYYLDRMGGSKGIPGIVRSIKFSMVMVAAALPLTIGVFFASSQYVFYGLMAVAEFMLFTVTGPINGAVMGSVPTWLRAFAMGMTNALIHLLGDFPSPIVVGAISDATGSRSIAMVACTSWNGGTILLWALALRYASNQQYSPKVCDSDDDDGGITETTGFLADNDHDRNIAHEYATTG